MNLSSFSDEKLISSTERVVQHEREILIEVLYHLKEVDRRRLFSALGFKSLFEFARVHLKYSEDQAYRRISAMRLLREVPEVEEKINSGSLTLSHLDLAQSLFRAEKKTGHLFSQAEKLSVISQISDLPVRQAEKITTSLLSEPKSALPDQIKIISDNKVEMRISTHESICEKTEKLKALYAHRYPNLTTGELFHLLCDEKIKELEKTGTSQKHCVKEMRESAVKDGAFKDSTKKISYAQTLRDVRERAKNQCENCKSQYALEIDHIKPRAKGGLSTKKNLRLLCKSCNQRAAIREFGVRKMETFIFK